MILAVDVDYRNSRASTVGIGFNGWRDDTPSHVYRSTIHQVEDYKPGSFYQRELPCILTLLREHNLSPDIIVIDGYVYLGDDATPGLGMHLYNALGGKIPVIGVAKSPFKGTTTDTELFRGDSHRPLYITAAGMAIDAARSSISSMHGNYRIPTLLQLADRECRRH
ncbi:endonuclease V [Microbulbifer marinus]|uniref:Endonuclease V n=1 Tax=Microbulbifer marinus TaxID=658218 RepID=A0A1H3WJI8_9GAMM|nr:endonuclease V [Microbulbifer marinus]SDZ87110.1 Endonuclease V [Microbulbifer marinus]